MMNPASRRLAMLLTVPLLLFVSSVSAGPVQAGEAGVQAEGMEEAPATLSALPGKPLGGGTAPSPVANHARPITAAGADPGAAASTLAAEILKEAEAGAQASESPRKAKALALGQAPASSPSTRAPARTAEDDWGLREIGKAAAQWVKASVPWLRSDTDEGAAESAVALDSADPPGSTLDGGPEGPGARLGTAQLPGASRRLSSDPASTVGYGRSAQPVMLDPGQNVLRMVIDVIREVLEHPMTWLVVSLFVIGGFAVKKIDRRPTK